YVSGVDFLTMHGRHVLYINNGDGTFTDRTKEYGLDFAGFSTQALFFDYDADGDLDMYLVTHPAHPERSNATQRRHASSRAEVGDRLYRNDGGHFVDVRERAGLYGGAVRYGLGVVASDLNLDGCPDLYVANDFQEDDFLYLNNCDGTFTESGATALGHMSHAAMGVDAADFNNDGRPDVVVLDMLPDQEKILKTSANAESFDVYLEKLAAGYRPQYAHNTLQQGFGQLAGTLIRKMPQVPTPNYAYRNNGDLTFTNQTRACGLAEPGFSNGAAYVDLNNSGALDLVVNRLDASAAIYRNRARE